MSKLIPNAHSAADCWNPHYHAEGFKRKSAAIFKEWYIKQYHGTIFHRLERFDVAPLCVFGGTTISPYTCAVSSLGGTYAVCAKCERVMMCGYVDGDGLNPRACEGCGAKLAFNDYFQPVVLHERNGKPVDPARDPAMTIAELCAYVLDGVPSHALPAWIAILASKDLLTTGGFPDYGRFELRSSGMESPELREAILRERLIRVDPTTPHWNIVLDDRGRTMLEARGIGRIARAKKELDRLRVIIEDRARLKAEAVAALAALLNR